jgi:hypothetical protein
MQPHELLFLAWAVVFAYWIWRQFSAANKKYDKQREE